MCGDDSQDTGDVNGEHGCELEEEGWDKEEKDVVFGFSFVQ